MTIYDYEHKCDNRSTVSALAGNEDSTASPAKGVFIITMGQIIHYHGSNDSLSQQVKLFIPTKNSPDFVPHSQLGRHPLHVHPNQLQLHLHSFIHAQAQAWKKKMGSFLPWWQPQPEEGRQPGWEADWSSSTQSCISIQNSHAQPPSL